MTCQWFALCPNNADGEVWHPILGDVPVCMDCAEKLDLSIITYNCAHGHPDSDDCIECIAEGGDW